MGDEALKLQEAIQRASELQITNSIVFLLMVIVIVAVVVVFLRNSTTQATETKAQGALLVKQLDLQGKQLDAFNNVANQVGRLESALSLQNTRFTEYHNNVQKNLETLTSALDSTLKNSITAVTALGRVEKNGEKMIDELGNARKDVKDVAEKSEAAKSGIHTLTEIVTTALTDIKTDLGDVMASVKDLPQIRQQLADAINGIEQLKHDVQRMDVPRTETKPPDAPPVSAEGD